MKFYIYSTYVYIYEHWRLKSKEFSSPWDKSDWSRVNRLTMRLSNVPGEFCSRLRVVKTFDWTARFIEEKVETMYSSTSKTPS